MIQRQKKNSSKVNLTISFIFHGTLVLAVFYFAAREGMLGKKLKEISAYMVKEKKPEPPKEKPPEPKVEPPKMADAPKQLAAAPRVAAAAAPPPSDSAPSVAPAAVSLPSFEFNDGAHAVETTSDPNAIYKGLIEHALRSHWSRPDDIADDSYAADIELTVDPDGSVKGYRWVHGSGDAKWDDSVKLAVAATKTLSRPLPKGFPSTFTVRFDVEAAAGNDNLQFGIR